MKQELQDAWAIALDVATDAPTTGSVVVKSSVLIAVYDEMEALRDENQANAKLIAAAPKLGHALRDLVGRLVEKRKAR
jgi:hypothetical protein